MGGSNEPPIVGRFCPVVGYLNATKRCAISSSRNKGCEPSGTSMADFERKSAIV